MKTAKDTNWGVTSQSRGNGKQDVTSQPNNHGKLNCSKRDLTSQVLNNDNEIGHTLTHTHTHKCVTPIQYYARWLQMMWAITKFIDKKIITQKSKARRYKEQLSTLLIPGAS